MRVKPIEQMNGTEICAEDVRNDLDFVLIPKGSKIKSTYLSALHSLGIKEILVEEDSEIEDKHIMCVPREIIESFVKDLNTVYDTLQENQSLEGIEILAERIVDFCKDNPKLMISVKQKRTESILEHSVMVSIICIMIGMRMDIVRSKLYQMAMAALVHDFGLMELHYEYTNFIEEELDEQKKEELHHHPITSFNYIKDLPFLTEEARDMIVSHHERMNGKGYPGKKCRQRMVCRIIQAADAYDRMLVGLEGEKKLYDEIEERMQSQKTCRYDREVIEILFQLFAK